MSDLALYTIGVYGSTEASFFKKLEQNNIDTFCDIRQRRGVGGVNIAMSTAYTCKRSSKPWALPIIM